VKNLALCVALPALGIVAAALAQLLLTTIWPGLQQIGFGNLSADSHIVVVLEALLAFLAGAWLQHRVGSLAGALCAAFMPVAWCGVLLWGTLRPAHNIAWLRPVTLMTIAAAVAPVSGVLAGWFVSFMRQRRMIYL
jgi:hypothetical protein